MEARQLGARQRRRQRRDLQAVGPGDGLGRIDHPAAADGDERPAADVAPHRRSGLRDGLGGHMENDVGERGEVRGRALGPRRRQQREAGEAALLEQRGRIGERRAAVADEPLAVEPGERLTPIHARSVSETSRATPYKGWCGTFR